jgi:predicted GNAT family N-acyltransferase
MSLNIPSDFFIEPADFAHARADIAAVRDPVFSAELGVPADIVWDAVDAQSRHVLARDLEGHPIGAGRLTPQHAIGRLAVLRAWRGRGVGRAMLDALVDQARQLRLPAVTLDAESKAVAFYLNAGFVTDGALFEHAGVLHQPMRLDLATAPPLEREGAVPNAESAEIEFDGLAPCREALLPLLRTARRQLCIYTRAMDPELFSGDEVLRELRRIATAGRGAEIRVLVQDPDTALHDGAPLLALAQRLSSAVQVRTPDQDGEQAFAGAYVINDQAGLLFRPIGSRYEGSARHHAPGHHRQLQDQFRHAWDRASPTSILRSQSL